MKKLLLLLYFVSVHAYAYDPVDCVNDLIKVDPNTVNFIAIRLCSGATSQEPVKCYARAPSKDKEITVGISASLCAGSNNADKTLACYDRAFNSGAFNRGQSRDLCTARYVEQK